MKGNKLRSIEYITGEYIENKDGTLGIKYATNKGYFHEWFTKYDYADGFQVSNHYAVIETKEGKIKHINPEDIKFI